MTATDDPILRADVVGTAVFVGTAAGGVVAPGVLGVPSAGVALVLFAAGCVAFVVGFLAGVGRSRHETVELGALILLTGAPAPVRNRFRLLLAVQCVVGIAAAAARPFTEMAFGVLVPVFGLGLMVWWGGRHGEFEPRHQTPRPIE